MHLLYSVVHCPICIHILYLWLLSSIILLLAATVRMNDLLTSDFIRTEDKNSMQSSGHTVLCEQRQMHRTHISPLANNVIDITQARRQTDNTLVDCSAAVLLSQLLLSYWNPAQRPHSKPNWIAAGYICWQDFVFLAVTITRRHLTV